MIGFLQPLDWLTCCALRENNYTKKESGKKKKGLICTELYQSMESKLNKLFNTFNVSPTQGFTQAKLGRTLISQRKNSIGDNWTRELAD